jgi:hypothetical protein
MSGADTVVERSTAVIEAAERVHSVDLRRKLEKAAALIEPEVAAGICLHEYDALAGMEAARRWVELVAKEDKIERTHLRRLAQKFGPNVVDEILADALLALCTPISPLFGVWLSPWFMNPGEGYDLTRKAINLARKNWTNRRHRLPASLDELCGAFIGQGGDNAPDFNDVIPDDRGTTVEETADHLGLHEKLLNFSKALPDDEHRVAELLAAGHPVSEVMALAGASKYEVQVMRKRIAAELTEYRPVPTRKRR